MRTLTPAMEDYLKVIYKLQQKDAKVTTQAIAKAMRVKPASVTNMLKKLARLRLVQYSAYKGVRLTPTGERMALEIIRHHRLLELYLRQALNMPLHKVHEEAERLEHALSEELEDLIAAALGNPTHDPHGHPIPTKEGHFDEPPHQSLSEAPHGQKFLIVRVSDSDTEMLRYLEELGLVPHAIVTVLRREPFGGPIWVQVDDRTHALGQEVAHHVFVRPLAEVKANVKAASPRRSKRRPA
ncbi:Iron-dependent repressor IdeR [bacterium HR17]|jgi:DtxR family Mn-dependent transcriptional regulator|uniref:Manganese transport regulator n=1 Tax=Candidatus Fervidibacter japonicus TaxID=2035412 RepID=A0A2H5XBB5_9BACT|nr:Iron-dependent repressor IdeR [bacterium HR17]